MKMNKEIESLVKSMFMGNIDEAEVFDFPAFSQDDKEMGKEMVTAVQKFAAAIDSEKFDRENKIPDEIIQGLAELGLCGLAVDEDFGGLNLSHGLYARVFSEIASLDGAIATTLGAHQSIGYKALMNVGSDQQKSKWLPLLASGEVLAAFCLTEPGSGSDAYSIKTKATVNHDGTYTITGQKLWITNGGKAGFYTVFCKTEDKDKKEKITCFIVEGDRPGLSFGEKEDKMGIRGSETRAVYFDKVQVPAENILGGLGQGFKIAMNVLNTGRLSLGSGSVGGMKQLLKLAVEHSLNRRQFDRPIAEFGLIQEKIVAMSTALYACESMVYLTTGKIEQGMNDYSIESAICKVYCSEKLWECANHSMQIAAGNGYMKEYPYERLMRDSRINLIFEGTNEILRVFIALSGLKAPSDSLKELGKISDVSSILQDPIKSVGVLAEFAKSRINKMMSSKTLTRVDSSLEKQAQQFSNHLSDFSIKVENTLIKYGKKIIGTEMLQLRLANMAIELYAQLAVLSRTTWLLKQENISEEQKKHSVNLTLFFFHQSSEVFSFNSRLLNSQMDQLVPSLAKEVCDRQGYSFDVLDH